MKASERWTRLRDFAPGMEEQIQLFWGEFHTDDAGPGGDRRDLVELLRDPVEALNSLDLGAGVQITDEWTVHSTFANHGFGVYWQRCLVALMISPAERSIALHAWKVRPPTKRPRDWDERSPVE